MICFWFLLIDNRVDTKQKLFNNYTLGKACILKKSNNIMLYKRYIYKRN